MSIFEKIISVFKPYLGNKLDIVRVGFQPVVGRAANYMEGSKVTFKGNIYLVRNGRWENV
jgi:hypothetical protein